MMRKRKNILEAEELLDEEYPDHAVNSHVEKTYGDKSIDLREAINRLPGIEKQIIRLFYADELKIREVAKVLDVPIGTVKSRLNRARNMLKSNFDS